MTNVPPIPPLLCNTPPPIDFGEEEEEDSGLPPTLGLDDEDEFGDFALATTSTNEDETNADVPSLPRTPLQNELSSSTTTSGYTDLPPAEFEDHLFSVASSSTPPPLEATNAAKQLHKPQANPLVEALNFDVITKSPTSAHKITVETNADDLDVTLQEPTVNANKLTTCHASHETLDNTVSNEENDDGEELVSEEECNSSLPSLKFDSLSLNSGKQSSATSTPPPSFSFAASVDNVNSNETLSDNDENSTFEINGEATEKQITSVESNKIIEAAEAKEAEITTDKNVVVLEDIVDDSSDDERHSPKKQKSLMVDENSEEYFAIHCIADEEEYQQQNVSATPVVNDDENESKITSSNDYKEMHSTGYLNVNRNDSDDDFDDFAGFEETHPISTETKFETLLPHSSQQQNNDNDNAFEADFSQFSSFDTVTQQSDDKQLQQEEQKDTCIENIPLDAFSDADDNDDFDDFDDFQDFSAAAPQSAQIKLENPEQITTAPAELHVVSNTSITIATEINKASIEVCDDDDDDFGDFAEVNTNSTTFATVVSTDSCASATLATSATLNLNNLNTRLKPVLEMMFPASETDSDEKQFDTTTVQEDDTLKLESVDTARALEYQWINSEVRHALIKSLGIDSRNILFGEKWNSSMPRFAANLSFDPLKPMKPTQANDTTATTNASSSLDIGEYHLHHQQQMANDDGLKPDVVPPVDFDWNSSSLVNPLDGSKEDAHSREAETLHTPQSGESTYASDSNDVEQQRQQQAIKHTNDASNETAATTTGTNNSDEVATNKVGASGIDTTTATSTNAGATATTALSSIVSTDSYAVDISNNGNHTDLKRTPYDINIEALGLEHNDSSIGTSFARHQLTINNNINSSSSVGNNLGARNEIDDSEDEVVTTSTYAGPLKETHIYTPSKVGVPNNADNVAVKIVRPTPANAATVKVEPIDFDYEIAAAGIVIDETVVKKEYRDIEYNPSFTLDQYNRDPQAPNTEIEQSFKEDVAMSESPSTPTVAKDNDFDDEFSDFQSVPAVAPPPVAAPPSVQNTPISNNVTFAHNLTPPPILAAKTKPKDSSISSRTSTPTFADAMILSPAILLPQAISINNHKPKIEWGDTAANINPEELARIEELFPQPKIIKTKEIHSAASVNANNTQKSTPSRERNNVTALSISATIAKKEQQQTNDDDEDWSDFVSVPVAAAAITTQHMKMSNNNHLIQQRQYQQQHMRTPLKTISPQHMAQKHQQQLQRHVQQQQLKQLNSPQKNNLNLDNCNDDEWSDFVSSAPMQPAANAQQMNANLQMRQFNATAGTTPQFNSAAWQNANFYKNPLSFYHQNPGNVVPKTNATQTNTATASAAPKLHNNNNHYSSNNNFNQQYLSNQHTQSHNQHQPSHPQQIHIMQDFSTAAPAYYRPDTIASNVNAHNFNQQFQVGTAKVAPSISLIPDLGFVAPAIPTHTAFINALPKPSFGTTTTTTKK